MNRANENSSVTQTFARNRIEIALQGNAKWEAVDARIRSKWFDRISKLLDDGETSFSNDFLIHAFVHLKGRIRNKFHLNLQTNGERVRAVRSLEWFTATPSKFSIHYGLAWRRHRFRRRWCATACSKRRRRSLVHRRTNLIYTFRENGKAWTRQNSPKIDNGKKEKGGVVATAATKCVLAQNGFDVNWKSLSHAHTLLRSGIVASKYSAARKKLVRRRGGSKNSYAWVFLPS